jgi:hypothetical protein
MDDLSAPQERVCQGTLLSRQQFLVDTQQWGYRDGRLEPLGNLTEHQVAELNAEVT